MMVAETEARYGTTREAGFQRQRRLKDSKKEHDRPDLEAIAHPL